MNEDVEILTAAPEDAEGVARLSYQVGKIHDDAMPDYFSPTSYEEHLRITREMLKDEKIIVFKAVCESVLCGFLFLFVPDKPRKGFVHALSGYIYNLGVDEAYRGRGIGSMLVKNAEMFLRERGILAVELNVFKFNKQALSFYQKLGYGDIEVTMHKVLK